jgi:hypothetical protein
MKMSKGQTLPIELPKKGARFTGYSMRQQPRFPKSTADKDTQFTLVPIPKRHA